MNEPTRCSTLLCGGVAVYERRQLESFATDHGFGTVERKCQTCYVRNQHDKEAESLRWELWQPVRRPRVINVGDTLTYKIVPYRGAEEVTRTGVFCMWDYENTGGLDGSYRTGRCVIDRGNGLTDIINYAQIIPTTDNE